jgi:hypothetical protein
MTSNNCSSAANPSYSNNFLSNEFPFPLRNLQIDEKDLIEHCFAVRKCGASSARDTVTRFWSNSARLSGYKMYYVPVIENRFTV